MRDWKVMDMVRQVPARGQGPRDYVVESEEAWLRAMANAHAMARDDRAVKALLVDPFSKTVEEIDTADLWVRMDGQDLEVTIAERSLARAMRTPVSDVITNCIADCAEDGAFLTATAKGCKNGIVPKECGFRLLGVPFFGVVALTCGLELYSPITLKRLQVSVPLSIADVPPPEWLGAGDVRRTRKERLRAGRARMREALSTGEFDIMLELGRPSTCYDKVIGTCCECRREGVSVSRCERCRSVYYCGRECQRAAWLRVHHGECRGREEV